MSKKNIVLASNNSGKLKEFSEMLANKNWTVQAQREFDIEEAEETGLSFVENAIIKARHAAKHTDLAAIADDSGLEVDALQGAPGIYSARYAGTGANGSDNNQKLLHELTDVPTEARTARYQCVLVFMRHALDPTPLIFHGCWEGSILREARGEGGFGYDPLFFVPELKCSAAELAKEQKNSLSHRGKAMAKLAQALSQLDS